jgi:DNA-binding CsgD family transcriptional regulator
LNDPETTVRLHYQDKGLRINFTATRFLDPEHVRFAYRLMGFDTVWRVVGADQRQAVFSTLPGGDYTFQVRAANRDGVWTTTPRTLRVIVDPPFWQTWWFIGVSILAGLVIAAGMISFLLARQRKRLQEKTREAEREVLRLKNENLLQDVQNKQDQLSASVLQGAHKNQFLADLKAQIRKMEHPESDLHRREWLRILRAIDQELDQKDYWDQFQLTFNQTHQDFVEALQLRHPTLTPTENRLCGFIRMGFSNSEIASILNITVNGVEQSKYRLKLKLDLDKNTGLNDYIRAL